MIGTAKWFFYLEGHCMIYLLGTSTKLCKMQRNLFNFYHANYQLAFKNKAKFFNKKLQWDECQL